MSAHDAAEKLKLWLHDSAGESKSELWYAARSLVPPWPLPDEDEKTQSACCVPVLAELTIRHEISGALGSGLVQHFYDAIPLTEDMTVKRRSTTDPSGAHTLTLIGS